MNVLLITSRVIICVITALSSYVIRCVNSCPGKCSCQSNTTSGTGNNNNNGIVQTTVNCSSLSLTFVPKFLPNDVQALVLSRNNLSDLYEQLPPLPKLIYLDLSRNQIKQLGRGMVFHNLTFLKYLDLSFNEIRTFFNGVFRGLHGLEILVINNAHVKFIDEHVFDGLENLKVMDLRHNDLHSIFPEWFVTLHRLEVLNIGNNYISYLNGGMFSFLKSLKELILSGNKIRGVHDRAFSEVDNLATLMLDNNQLTKVPALALQTLKRLRTLRLNENFFYELSTGDFIHVPLTELSVSNAPNLHLIDRGAFWDLPMLETLELHSNRRLQYIDPDAFLNLPSLKVLRLHDNNLLALNENAVKGVTGPLQISIYGNPLLCDCNVHWIYNAITNASATPVSGSSSTSGSNSNSNFNNVEFLESDAIKCAEPSDLKSNVVSKLQRSLVPTECAPVLVGRRNSTINKKIGGQHVFQCRAYGIPAPTIRWILPNGSLLNESSNGNIHIHFSHQGSLTIFHLKPADSGKYKCLARNEFGEATSEMHLNVENVDIQIFPSGVSATFVTVVWNGTARNRFPEYEILYKLSEDATDQYKSVTVSQFFKSYTINNLQPESRYKFCLAVKDDEENQYVQISCTTVLTRDANFMMQGIHHTSNVAVAAVLGIIAVMLLVICLVTVAARKYRQRLYETPEKKLVNNMSQIPLENLYSPLMTHFGP